MLESPHVFVGAAIAAKIPHPIAIPLAFGSHFLLDILPHWNPHINTEIKKFGKPTKKSTTLITFDSIFALISGFAISSTGNDQTHMFLILAASFAAVLPDVVEAPYYFLGQKSKLVEKWIKWQKSIQNDVSPIPGLLAQVAIIGASIWWILS